MDLKFSCPGCSQPLTVDDSATGQYILCPSCNSEVQVPSKGTRRMGGDAPVATPPPFNPETAAAAPPVGDPAPVDPSQLVPIPTEPPAEEPDFAPEVDESGKGFSAGILAGMLDRRLMVLKSRNVGAAFTKSAKVIKLVGDMALLVIAVAWLGMSMYTGYQSGQGDAEAKDPKAAGNATAAPEEDKATPEQVKAAELFAKVVEPAFEGSCYQCHGEMKQDSRFNLAIRDNAGNVEGILAKINTENPSESEVYKRITAKDDSVMPQEAWANGMLVEEKLLKKEVVDAFLEWVTAGAPDKSLALAVDNPVPPKSASMSKEALIALGKALLTGVLAVFLVLIIHYLTGRFFDANDSVIAASTPSRISSATVPNALSVFFWICSVGILVAALIKSATLGLQDIKVNWLTALVNLLMGGLLFAFALSLARIFVADEFLNIKASGEANSGDEALGVFSLFIKVGLKMAPVYYGLLLCVGCLFYLLDTFWPERPLAMESLLMGGYIEPIIYGHGISLATVGIDLAIPSIVALPVKAYFYFLAAFLLVEVARAVLNISRRLGAR